MLACMAICLLSGSVASGQERLPAIFIPGVTGSFLQQQTPRLVLWPPIYPEDPLLPGQLARVNVAFTRLSLNPNTPRLTPFGVQRLFRNVVEFPALNSTIEAPDVIRYYGATEVYGPILEYLRDNGPYVEYDVAGDARRRTLQGCVATSQQPKPSLFVFAYDWRLAIEDNADLLAEYMRCVGTVYPGRKVNIVTHSMGGLVARRYIIDHPNTVNKLITIAAPFLGAAKPLYQMQFGLLDAELSIMGTIKEVLYGPAVKDMLMYFPGLHELMLSRRYYELGGAPYSVLYPLTDQSDADIRSWLRSSPPTPNPFGPGPTYDDVLATLDRLFPGRSYNGKTAAQSGRDFHEYSRNGNSQDDWSNDTTGVRYSHLIALQNSGDTPESVVEVRAPQTSFLSPPGPLQSRYFLAPVGPGDGTVPRMSAERIGGGRSLNAPTARLFFFNTGPDALLEHGNVVNNRSVQNTVLELLRLGETPPEESRPLHKVRSFIGPATP